MLIIDIKETHNMFSGVVSFDKDKPIRAAEGFILSFTTVCNVILPVALESYGDADLAPLARIAEKLCDVNASLLDRVHMSFGLFYLTFKNLC